MDSSFQLKNARLALKDFLSALSHHRIWMQLAWVEIKQRYRRSVIGPWWITLSTLIFILAMGTVFSRIFKQGLDDYIPFFTSGFLFWVFISSSATEATEVLKLNASYIKQVKMPFNLYLLKHLTRQTIFLAHNFVVYFFVMLYFHRNPGWVAPLAFPGFLLLLINMYWICMLVALLSTRYRDMVPIITSCMQIAFFITPISWMPKLLSTHSLIMKLNPLVYFLGAIRNPLLGEAPTLHTWIYNVLAAFLGSIFTFFVFSQTRKNIPFWVD